MSTIYYYAYDHQKPRGGQKSVYRHVDILRANGRDAHVLHTEPGYRLAWFENNTSVVDGSAFRARFDPLRDVLVLPEDLGPRLGSFPGRKVIFNQNVFYGFYAFGFRNPPEYAYLRDDVIGAMVVSDHNRASLEFAFPRLRVHRVVNGFDTARFAFGEASGRKLQIACLPTKAEVDLTQVIHLVNARARQGRNTLSAVEWVHLRGLPEAEVAKVLRESLALLFLSIQEGLPRLPIEAMLSGAVVAGFTGGPLGECLAADRAVVAPTGDVVSLVEGLERIGRWFADGDPRLADLTGRAREAASWHSFAREEQTVLAAWDALLPRG